MLMVDEERRCRMATEEIQGYASKDLRLAMLEKHGFTKGCFNPLSDAKFECQ
jgi:hypothetical protein